MKLEQRDLVEPETSQRALALALQVRRVAVHDPLARARPLEAGLGADHEVVRVRVERLRYQAFGDLRPVRVGRVDEVHAELDGPLEDAAALVGVVRLAPDPAPGQLHRAEAGPLPGQLAADVEGSGRSHERPTLRLPP